MHFYVIHESASLLAAVWYNADMEITLEELLNARDDRAAYEKQLLKRYRGACLVVFTVNVPGADKTTPEAARLFTAGIRALGGFLQRYELVPLFYEAREPVTGYEAYLALKTDASFLKLELIKLESSAPYGRLWDMDVISAKGVHLSREDVGFPERSCIVCGKRGRACASRRLHPMEEVQKAFIKLVSTLPPEQV
ncbi:MAG: citrate lyase holo-[acyl-carrier protein] synthase [Clostridiaceae bacterium]